MKRITASVTERGQVTIPAEVRRKLRLRPRDKVDFILENGQVRIERPKYTSVEEVFGSLPPLPVDVEEAIEIAKEDRAERIMQKMRREG